MSMDASCSSSSNKRKRSDIEELRELPRKVNDHIYELYTPKEGLQAVKLEIVFFHGLHYGSTSEEAYHTTWTNADKVLWPKTWLPEEFPQVRVLSVSYDASMKQTAKTGRQDLYIIAENLTQDIADAQVGQSVGCPIILVGHCFGGLVIKQLCFHAATSHNVHKNEKMGKFLDNLEGVFFYGTPHRGTDFPKFLSKLLGGHLLDYVTALNEHAARLDGDFLAVCRNHGLRPERIASVGEKNKTKILGKLAVVIVPEGSARYENYLYTLDADHFSICKPTSKTCNRFKLLSTFIRDIEPKKQVQTTPDDFQVLMPKKSVGLDVKVKAIRERLEEKKIVGIVGMGGIGKTTLAKAAFNKFSQFFDFTCFVLDVKLIAGGIEALKNKVSQSMCRNGKYMKSSGMEWKGKRLLLVLDDIRDIADADVLSTMVCKAGPGSWFLVTCRDRDVLKNVEDIEPYEMPLLSPSDAERLFMSYAFTDGEKGPQHLDALVKKMVNKCDGLPLTLEVIGKCLLKNEEKKFWVQMYDALEKAERFSTKNWENLWWKLRLSFNNLKHEEQQMFLDATTFFSNSGGMSLLPNEDEDDSLFESRHGWHWKLSDAKAAWSVAHGNEEIRWNNLVNASLVYDVKDEEPIRVHEQLKSLGRKIAEENKCKRVWNTCIRQELLLSDLLSDYQEIHSLRATFSPSGFSSAPELKRKREEIPREWYSNLKELKYLESDSPPHNTTLRIGASESLEKISVDLIVLCSPTLSFGQAPIDFTHRRNPQMAVLILTDHCETFLPESLVTLSSLKIFFLQASILQELPLSFGKLWALEQFVVRNCRALSTLPASFGDLRALKELRIEKCILLDSLSDDFGKLSALEKLEIAGCDALSTLPASFGSLRALKELRIYECPVFGSLSDDFGNLSALEKLDIDWCPTLSTLPASFGSLRALKELRIYECPVFGSLSDDFGNLSALEKLDIDLCYALSTLPASFGSLRALKELWVFECPFFGSLSDDFGNLSALEKLDIYLFPALSTLPASFGSLRALKELRIWSCEVFDSLSDDFGNLSALEKLDIYECPALSSLPTSFGNLRALKELRITTCQVFDSLSDDFGNLSALEELYITSCPALSTLPTSFGSLRALKKLIIRRCDVLGDLSDSFENLIALEELQISYCPVLTTCQYNFGNLRALKTCIVPSVRVTSIEDIRNLEDVAYLRALIKDVNN